MSFSPDSEHLTLERLVLSLAMRSRTGSTTEAHTLIPRAISIHGGL